ncbi:MAG: ABC transporter permease [Desulfomonile tiedjei]|uniref:ABC transporter permease n=1 Tax=Desulfomonile tiedjei TaxID=2358 RepID=A0A9D6V637_9BACT|nr:ABC transporter permease [Desulfomonile tiedjei]
MRLLPFDYAVRNLGRSRTRLVLTIMASALVVLLVLTAAAFVRGMANSLVNKSAGNNVILMAAGSEESLERSQIPGSTAGIVAASLPGIKNRFGVTYVSPEIHAAIIVKDDKEGSRSWHAVVRGFLPEASLVHPRASVIQGRMPKPGKDEIMVGGLAAEMMGVPDSRVAIGQSLWFDNRRWNVVGRFTARGTVLDCEIWVPLTDLQVATKRETVSCLVVTLDDAEFADVDAFTKQRFDLGLTAISETDYYASIMKFYQPVHAMVWTTAFLIGLTGLFGGLNTMYAAFAARVRELGMLQSLGFPRRAIMISIIQESLLTSATGTLIGSMLGMLLLNGRAVKFSMGVFQLVVDYRVLLLGVAAGLIMGVLGAMPPAWRCLRLPIIEALKAS